MIEYLNTIDTRIFLILNSFHTEALDQFMALLSHKLVWVPFYLMITGILVRRYGWRGALIVSVGIAVAVTVADQTCATLIRPVVQRLRPAHPDSPIVSLVHIVNGYRGGHYGFPSCHAANTLAVATFLSLVFRKRRGICVALWAWVVFNCYSRIYLGVHYPGDLLAGGLIGMLSGGLAGVLTKRAGAWLLRYPLRPSSDDTVRLHIGGTFPEVQLTNSALVLGTGLLTTGILLTVSLISHFI